MTGHQLEVTAMHGRLGEELPLVERLPAHTDATKWLSSLEQLMRTSLQTLIEECVIARFDGGKAYDWICFILCLFSTYLLFSSITTRNINHSACRTLVQPAGKSLFHLKYPILLVLNLSYVISLGSGKETFRLS